MCYTRIIVNFFINRNNFITAMTYKKIKLLNCQMASYLENSLKVKNFYNIFNIKKVLKQ